MKPFVGAFVKVNSTTAILKALKNEIARTGN